MNTALAEAIMEMDDIVFLERCEPVMSNKSWQEWDSLVEDAAAITEEYPYRWAKDEIHNYLVNAEAARLESEE
jgi:hypothetical protein